MTSACPSGWALYADVDGVEQHDSCLKYCPYYMNWANAKSACESYGGHLLTVLGWGKNVGIMRRVWEVAGGADRFWVGCGQTVTTTSQVNGFVWVDGTANQNINCGQGCNLYYSGEPK